MDGMETASIESSGMEASRIGGPRAGSERLGGVKGLAEVGHASTSVSHALQGVQEGLTSLTSKPGVSPVRPDGGKSKDAWHHHEACVEAKRSREGAGSVQ